MANDPHYKGEPTPKHLKDGPLRDRRCTDVFCLLVFLGFWAGLILMSLTAVHTGNPLALTYAYDQFGNQCGQNNQTDFPYLYFIQAGDGSFSSSQTVCIKDCPSDGQKTPVDCAADYNAHGNGYDCSSITVYGTTPLVNRFCLPNANTSLSALTGTHALDFGFAFKAVSDIKATWWVIIVVGVLALAFGFAYLILMKYFAGILIWAFLIVFVLLFAGFGFITLEDALGVNLSGITPDSVSSLSPFWLEVTAGVCFFVALLSLILICCFRTRINLAIAVLKAAADFVEEEGQILLLPPIFFVFSLAFYVLWALVAVYIVGMNDVEAKGDGTPLPAYEWSSTTVGMMAYHVFALFWNHAFFVASSQFIICSTVCLWYFKQGKTKVGDSPVWTSFKRTFLHLGSIAFGAFLIGLLDLVRAVLSYFHKRFSSVPTGESKEVGFCLACCNCLLGCFERSLKFLNRHAYIQMAMTGESFCTATADAFHLLLRNALRFGTVHGIAYIFTILGQLVVALGAAFIGFIIIDRTDSFNGQIYSPVVPSIIFLLTALIIAHVFMSIYGMSADTIIHCFAMDEEIHDGAAQHAPKELRDFVDTHLHKKLLMDD